MSVSIYRSRARLFHLIHSLDAAQTYCGRPWKHRGGRPMWAKLPMDHLAVTCKQCKQAWLKANPKPTQGA